jgi:hypothetical protein
MFRDRAPSVLKRFEGLVSGGGSQNACAHSKGLNAPSSEVFQAYMHMSCGVMFRASTFYIVVVSFGFPSVSGGRAVGGSDVWREYGSPHTSFLSPVLHS